ncbi:MAG: hypothetical protein COA58_15310 [Bacteroidetes bacterium]|nr:MAG: hypothetical protein COA58_15310 [Bacteroidota bacterium]
MAYKKAKQYRLPGYNYSSNDAYFVTIVCLNRNCFFGTISDGEMKLSEIGKIIKLELLMAIEYKQDIQIPKFVIMPNHVHLLIELQNEQLTEKSPASILPLGPGFERKGHIGPLQKGSLGSFVNHFKGRVTRKCKKLGFIDFAWQSRYHDRIVRGEKEYNRIVDYIESNIADWEDDNENLEV